MAEHILKCWPNSYDAIAAGVKCFEWRRDDRGFECGDTLVLRMWDPGPGITGVIPKGYVWKHFWVAAQDEQRVRVTYILRGQFGVPDGYCVMSIELIPVEVPDYDQKDLK
jgi:hypothetical protein